MVQLEDALGEAEQPNLPGTTRACQLAPQARAQSLEELADVPLVGGIAAAMAAAGRSFRR